MKKLRSKEDIIERLIIDNVMHLQQCGYPHADRGSIFSNPGFRRIFSRRLAEKRMQLSHLKPSRYVDNALDAIRDLEAENRTYVGVNG